MCFGCVLDIQLRPAGTWLLLLLNVMIQQFCPTMTHTCIRCFRLLDFFTHIVYRSHTARCFHIELRLILLLQCYCIAVFLGAEHSENEIPAKIFSIVLKHSIGLILKKVFCTCSCLLLCIC